MNVNELLLYGKMSVFLLLLASISLVSIFIYCVVKKIDYHHSIQYNTENKYTDDKDSGLAFGSLDEEDFVELEEVDISDKKTQIEGLFPTKDVEFEKMIFGAVKKENSLNNPIEKNEVLYQTEEAHFIPLTENEKHEV